MNGIRPVKLEAIRKEYIWGTEEWLFSALHEECSTVPLLIKKITANEALSVQVHPNDEFAKAEEGCSGKTEMWYVLDCEPDSYLYYGLKHQISPNEFQKRIQNGTITEVCRKMPVKKGDVFYIPAGLVHAIGKGITVAEVQQSSNITYRIFDYLREDEKGQRRELHISKAAQVAGFRPPLQGHRPMGLCQKKEGYEKTLLVQCPYFIVNHYRVKTVMESREGENALAVYVIEGKGTLSVENETMELNAGDCIFVPKEVKNYEIKGKLEILISEVPK